MNEWHGKQLIELGEIKTKITPFERELLGMFPGLKFIDLIPTWWQDLKVQGYMPGKVQSLMTYDIPRLSHEIAHMVEMNKFERLIQDDWGLYSTNRIEISQTKFKDPKFAFRAAARELRVKAIESYLTTSIYPYGRTLHQNWYDTLSYHFGFGRFKQLSDIDDWMRSIFETTRKQWSLDRIQHEWKQRVEFIRNWQESK